MNELGTRLVRAREARGLTLEDAERDTRISRRYLQALESEQFEAIPAPVYARGFLRSYSQYLGLDPQEMLDLFPRDDDAPPSYGREPQQRASPENPISAVSASRPTWRRPQPPAPPNRRRQETVGRARPPAYETPGGDDYDDRADEDDDRGYLEPAPAPRSRPRQVRPAAPPARSRQERYRDSAPREPMIGVDIGVPAPARRIKTDPAAQTRTLVVVGVAIGAIVVVIIIALLLSRAGGSASGVAGTPAGTASPAGVSGVADAGGSPSSSVTTTVAPGTSVSVPDVVNLQQASAEQLIRNAGLVPDTTSQAATQPKGTVIDQAPAPNSTALAGNTVHLVISAGQ
jgi:transcriptional regulator with XRE-family HTH domain